MPTPHPNQQKKGKAFILLGEEKREEKNLFEGVNLLHDNLFV